MSEELKGYNVTLDIGKGKKVRAFVNSEDMEALKAAGRELGAVKPERGGGQAVVFGGSVYIQCDEPPTKL